jgi:hypothetical protein
LMTINSPRSCTASMYRRPPLPRQRDESGTEGDMRSHAGLLYSEPPPPDDHEGGSAASSWSTSFPSRQVGTGDGPYPGSLAEFPASNAIRQSTPPMGRTAMPHFAPTSVATVG